MLTVTTTMFSHCERVACHICLDDTDVYQVSNKTIAPKKSNCKILKCNHVYHNQCIKQWYDKGINGHLCPCCRSNIQFRKHGSYYNDFMISSTKESKLIFQIFENLIHDDEVFYHYIYYDNANIQLHFTNTIINLIHNCFWYIHMKKDGLDTPI